MKIFAITAISAILLTGLMPHRAEAGFRDGNQLFDECKKSEKDDLAANVFWGACTGYIVGSVDQMVLPRQLADEDSCLPDNVNVGQLRDIVVKYLTENPAERSFPASLIVRLALEEAWTGCGRM